MKFPILIVLFFTCFGNLHSQSDSIVVITFNKVTNEPIAGITVDPNWSNETIGIDPPGVFMVDRYQEAKQLNIKKEGYNTGRCLLYNPETLKDTIAVYLMPTPDNTNPIFNASWDTKMEQLTNSFSLTPLSADINGIASDSVCKFPDIKAEFLGGERELSFFVMDENSYPEKALENEESGRVYLSFIVEIDGTLSNITVERGVSALLDAESVRVLQKMPKWIPGISGNRFVRTKYRLPIVYRCCCH